MPFEDVEHEGELQQQDRALQVRNNLETEYSGKGQSVFLDQVYFKLVENREYFKSFKQRVFDPKFRHFSFAFRCSDFNCLEKIPGLIY